MVWDAFLVAHYATSSRHLLVDIAALAIKDVLDSPILNTVIKTQKLRRARGACSERTIEIWSQTETETETEIDLMLRLDCWVVKEERR